jgi:hypothetical protein
MQTPDPIRIGPYRTNDLRWRRPYFVIPLLGMDHSNDWPQLKLAITSTIANYVESIRARLVSEAKDRRDAGITEPPPGPGELGVTDVYILSHGWHRNYFAAIAAYDRLVARLIRLMRRERLPKPEPYLPIFLALHWHSDPGTDGWEDRAGRRHLDSFIANVRDAFAHTQQGSAAEAEFQTDFENVFQLFAQVAAIGSDPNSPDLDDQAESILGDIHARYELRGGPGATMTEKAAVAWACYHEAQVKRVLLSQQDRSFAFGGTWTALKTLIKFVLAGGLAVTLLQQFGGPAKSMIGQIAKYAWKAYTGIPGVSDLAALYAHARSFPKFTWPLSLDTLTKLLSVVLFVFDRLWRGWVLLLPLGISCLALLALLAWSNQRTRQRRIERHQAADQVGGVLASAALILWLPAQIVFLIPLLAVCALGYLFGGPVGKWLMRNRGVSGWLLFRERTDTGTIRISIRELLSMPARLPAQLLGKAVPKDSAASQLSDGIENQLAFFEMQRKATLAGQEAGVKIAEIARELPDHWNPRFHFIGHSFGASVILNAARAIARIPEARKPRIHSLSLLQGAVATAWLEGEAEMQNAVEGVIACAYSGYDLANGFYYPFANNNRQAAGYLGFSTDANKRYPIFLGTRGEYASLVVPPTLDAQIDNIFDARLENARARREKSGKPKLTQAQEEFIRRRSPVVVNLDCSRFVYDGNPLLGGGHGDIFKNDVIHLVWAVTTIRSGVTGPPELTQEKGPDKVERAEASTSAA